MDYLKSLNIYFLCIGIVAFIALIFYARDIFKLYNEQSTGYELKYKIVMSIIFLYLVCRGFGLDM